MACIKKRDEQTQAQTTQKQYAPPTSYKSEA